MAIVGLIPFVYAAIKRKRRLTARAADRYEGVNTGGASRGDGHARGAYQSQSCYFAVLPSPDDELGFSYGAAGRPPPKEKDLSRSRELFQAEGVKLATNVAPASGRGNAHLDGCHQSQSCRFAVRPPLPVDEQLAPRDRRDDGASHRPPQDLLRQLLLPASRYDSLAPGSARGREHARSNGRAQSCRFVVRRSVAYELGLSYEDEYSAARTSPEDISGKLLIPAGRRVECGDRSMRNRRVSDEVRDLHVAEDVMAFQEPLSW